MKFVIENEEYKDVVYQVGVFTLILNQLEYVISQICEFEEDTKTLGQKRVYLEKSENSYLLPYWREEILSDLLKINKKRKIIIHGVSFVDPHKNISDGSSIEYKKDGEVINIETIKQMIEVSKELFKKLLCIHTFYTDENDDAVMDSYNSDFIEKMAFTFYPVSEERGSC